MLAMKRRRELQLDRAGAAGLTMQTRSAAMPTAMSGNCQTQADR